MFLQISRVGKYIKPHAYLEPSRTSTMKRFCEYSSKSRKLFLQKISIVDVRLDSKYTSENPYFLDMKSSTPVYQQLPHQ